MGVSSSDFPPPGQGASWCQAWDRWEEGETQICKQTQTQSWIVEKVIVLEKRMRLTRFLLLLLPTLVWAIPEATTLRDEGGADELERVRRGFYT